MCELQNMGRIRGIKKPRWTDEEDQKLRELYLKGSIELACKEFPERTESAIKNRVFLLRLRRRG